MTEWVRLLRTDQPDAYRLARVVAPTALAAAAAWLVTSVLELAGRIRL